MDFILISERTVNRMRNIHNALSDVVSSCRNTTLEYDILAEIPEETRWIVNVYNRDVPDSLLQFEVIDDNGIPKCCVLQQTNVSFRSMSRFMNRLVDELDS